MHSLRDPSSCTSRQSAISASCRRPKLCLPWQPLRALWAGMHEVLSGTLHGGNAHVGILTLLSLARVTLQAAAGAHVQSVMPFCRSASTA